MDEETLRYDIHWELSYTEFDTFIEGMINECRQRGKTVSLPIEIDSGWKFIGNLTALLAQVNCDGCDALCCRGKRSSNGVTILTPEYELLAEKYGRIQGEKAYLDWTINLPCPYLVNNRCSIYPDRPLVCIIYPFQPGGMDANGHQVMALDPGCPEGRRIAKATYMYAWLVRNRLASLGPIYFARVFGR